MSSLKSLNILLVFICASSMYAQKVMYKSEFYTVVNSKIFHRGYNVDGKLTDGAIDSIKVIAKELYNEKGRLKTEYKKRHVRQRYTMPEAFWEEHAVVASSVVKVTNTNAATPIPSSTNASMLAATGVSLIKPSDSVKTSEEMIASKKVDTTEKIASIDTAIEKQTKMDKPEKVHQEKTVNVQEKEKINNPQPTKTEKVSKEKSKSPKEKTKQKSKEVKKQSKESTNREKETSKEVTSKKANQQKKTSKQSKSTSKSKSTKNKSAEKQVAKKKGKINPVNAAAGAVIIKSLKGDKASKKTVFQRYFDKC